MTCLGGHSIHDHTLVYLALFGLDGINREEDFGVAVTRVARGVLRCFALNVVRCSHLPTGYGVGEDNSISLEQVSVGGYVTYNDVVVRAFCRLVWIPTNFEIEPRRIERTEGQALGILTCVAIRAVLVSDRVTHLARQFIFVQRVLQNVGIAHRVFVARFARHSGFVPHRCAYLSVAVYRCGLVAGHTRHFQFALMHVGGDEIIVAKELIANARAVTRGTRFFDRRVFARAMSCQESTPSECRATDVALSTRGMAFGAVVVECFAQDGRVHVRANGFKISPIAILIDVQIRLIVLSLLTVTELAIFFWLCAGFGNQTLMRGGFIRCSTVALVTKDTAEFAVCGWHKLGIAQKHFFPRFQRGHRPSSAFSLGLCRFFDFVDSNFLQRLFVTMTFDTIVARW